MKTFYIVNEEVKFNHRNRGVEMQKYPKFKKLTDERNRNGITQKKLAELINVTKDYICSIENGQVVTKDNFYCGIETRNKIISVLKKLKHDDFKVNTALIPHLGKVI